jgi:hypothetical protein
MAAFSHNHINYQARLDYIQQLLADRLGLSSKVSNQESYNHYHSNYSRSVKDSKLARVGG